MSIKGTHDPREEFAIAVGSVLIAPLAPIVIELGFTGSVGIASMLIAAIMYVAGLAFSTDRKIIFWGGFVGVAYLCLVYGAHVRTSVNISKIAMLPIELQKQIPEFGSESNSVYNSAIILMAFFGIAHFFQRARMHIKEAQPFLDFRSNNEANSVREGV